MALPLAATEDLPNDRFNLLVYGPFNTMLLQAFDCTAAEGRELLWMFVRKATAEMEHARTHAVFTVHAHRQERPRER